ncbi:MAG: DUF1311 domain-containing protein [Proteobacteria bacterium]|nr:DUF1311 domain-containing protein [Pseudomonadota bacterium]
MNLLRLLICLGWFMALGMVSPAAAQMDAPPSGGVSGQVDCGGDLPPADRMHCENVQLDAADKALNRVYQALMEVLDKDAKAMLLDGQRGWLKYRERNFELFSSAASTNGQQGMAEQLHFLRGLTVARVRELENLYRLFQQSGLLRVPSNVMPRRNSTEDEAEISGNDVLPGAFADSSEARGSEVARSPETPALVGGSVAPPQVGGTVEPVGLGDSLASDAVASAPDVSPPSAPSDGAAGESPLPLDPGLLESAEQAGARTEIKSQDGLHMLLGRHPLRLQWLSGERTGEAVIENRDGVLWLSGAQGVQGNQLLIKGRISTVREDNFTFHGTVATTLGFLNDGQPCVRKGRMWFVRKDGRPFWRLQSITSPCSGVSDYIDIYVDHPEQR